MGTVRNNYGGGAIPAIVTIAIELGPNLGYSCHCNDGVLRHTGSSHTLHDLLDGCLGESGATVDLILVLLRVGEGRDQQL